MMSFDDEERSYQIRKESEAQVNEVKMEIRVQMNGEMIYAIKFPLLIAWIHLIWVKCIRVYGMDREN